MKYLIAILFVFLLSLPSFGFGESPPSVKPKVTETAFVFENFENNEFLTDSKWWVFGNVNVSLVSNPAIGRLALQIKGAASNFFVGGIGGYIADFKKKSNSNNSLELDVYSESDKNGLLKIELYDDDNGNWQIEQEPSNNSPLFDDRFTYELKLDFKGWKNISIPFSLFVDDNREVGDDIWNPSFHGNSGGLLQIQFISIASSKNGKTNFVLDDLGFN